MYVGTNPITLDSSRSWAPEGNQWTTGWIFDPDYSHSMAAPITDIHLYSHRTQLCQIMKPTQIFTNGAPEYGICVVAYTRDSRGNHPGPGGKPAQYHSKTPPKGHTWFTHTTKNKVERLPSLRARYSTTVSHPCSHLYGTKALMRRPRSSSRSGLPQRASSHRDGAQRLVGSSYHLRDG